ncbi:NlpC/P60 family protein [Asanoa sp. WMMD1127]|uniref:C40 family peptidase n=1 Tax=Asanoa sp. WMMD1127 TaxID=3016107 RepID=UPI002416D92C|nr:NlpC/P60 family protein [Asanoa sp. WMMD1127]MDG4826955.1 NlpC/P60 family protein [Asanoa sp. WMMD1127]
MRAGSDAMVRVAVATLWSTPDAVRPIDSRALGRTADIPSWVASMSAEQQVGDGVLSQLLLGERVRVDEVRPDGWVRVVALQQPGVRDERGYPGWISADQLGPAPADVDDTTLVVDATATDLRAAPRGPVLLANVMLGTRLTAAGGPVDDFLPVRVGDERLWVAAADVVHAGGEGGRPTAALDVASRLRGVPYVWGGLSAYGIDCSGLVHLSWRRFGVTLPRDAADQAAATRSVPLGSEQPGDLYFFARPGRRIHHVGMVTGGTGGGPRRMLHACYTQRRVVEEPLSSAREDTLIAAHRVVD